MSKTPQDTIPEEAAREIWRRAVELQMEAARADQQRALNAGGESGAEGFGLSLDAVRSAALEAGISEEFVSLAVAEHTGSVVEEKSLTGWKDRAATRTLGTDQRTIEVVETLDVTPAEFLEGLRQVAPRRPYLLTLKDTIGDDPLNGAVLVFGTPGMGEAASNSFSYVMATVDIKQIRLSMRAVDDGAKTEVRITAPLGRSRRMNWIAGNAVGAVTGLGFAAIGLAIATATGAGLPVALGALSAGSLGGVKTATWGVGKAYRWGLKKAQAEFRGIIRAVRVNLRLGGDFMPRDDELRRPSDDGLELLL